jgi:hypothetical protein
MNATPNTGLTCFIKNTKIYKWMGGDSKRDFYCEVRESYSQNGIFV